MNLTYLEINMNKKDCSRSVPKKGMCFSIDSATMRRCRGGGRSLQFGSTRCFSHEWRGGSIQGSTESTDGWLRDDWNLPFYHGSEIFKVRKTPPDQKPGPKDVGENHGKPLGSLGLRQHHSISCWPFLRSLRSAFRVFQSVERQNPSTSHRPTAIKIAINWYIDWFSNHLQAFLKRDICILLQYIPILSYIHTCMHACITLHYTTLHYISLHFITYILYIYIYIHHQFRHYIVSKPSTTHKTSTACGLAQVKERLEKGEKLKTTRKSGSTVDTMATSRHLAMAMPYFFGGWFPWQSGKHVTYVTETFGKLADFLLATHSTTSQFICIEHTWTTD